MKKAPLVSVVVPVYNNADYLPACIDSILNQTIREFELFLVDDGSRDQSGAICDDYAGRDDRVHVFHQENKGVAAARNHGIREARGYYIAFVDGDDTVANDYLERLINAIDGGDLAVCGVVIHYAKASPPYCLEKSIPPMRGLSETYLAMERKGLFNSCWNKLYRISVLQENKIAFRHGYAEDLLFNLDYYEGISAVAAIPQMLYRYYKREEASLVTRYYAEMPIRVRECNRRRAELFIRLGLNSPEHQTLLAEICCDYLLICIPNAYRKDAPETAASRRRLMKSLLGDPDLAKWMKLFQPQSRYHMLFLRLYQTGSPVLMEAVYRILFFFRNHLATGYTGLRKYMMSRGGKGG